MILRETWASPALGLNQSMQSLLLFTASYPACRLYIQNNYRKINLFSFKNIKSDLDLNPEILKKLISGLIKIQKCATVCKIQKYATVYKIQKYATVYKIHKYATVYKIQKDASIYKIQKDATVYKIQKYATVYKIMPDVALGIDVSSFQNR